MNASHLGLISLLCLLVVCVVGGSAAAADDDSRGPGETLHRPPRGHGPAAGDRGRPLLVGRQHLGQGRRLSEEGGRRDAAEPAAGRPQGVRRVEGRQGRSRQADRPRVAAADRGALSAIPGQPGRSRVAQGDHRQGQRGREGVQRLPAQGRRQGTDRQRSARRSSARRRTRPQRQAAWEASKGVGPRGRGRPEGAGQAAQPGRRKLGFKDYHVMQLPWPSRARSRCSSCSTSSTS